MSIPVNPRIEPIDRSMFRDTMIRTMPVAMTATDADWTDRFHRLRVVRNDPPDRMLNAIQMTTVAAIMPSNRVSISIDRRIDRIDRAGWLPPRRGRRRCSGSSSGSLTARDGRRALLRGGGAGRED